MPDRVYLDWNATTPLRSEAKAAFLAACELTGNPSSVHTEGRQARRLVEEARAIVAQAVGASPRNLVFTSGGTEANHLALAPGLRGPAGPLRRLLVSAIEHASVLSGGRFPPDAIRTLPVTPTGILDLDALRAALAREGGALVSVMAANNETGVIQPLAEIARIVHEAGGLLHVDAIQALGKIPFDLGASGADLATLSAHKLGGPKGIGAIVIAEGLDGLDPAFRGGGQERGRRAGTENLPGIVAFGAAVRAAVSSLEADMGRIDTLRLRLEQGLRGVADVTIHGEKARRLPNTVLFGLPGLKAETAVIGFDLEGIAVSSGAACSSGKVQASHVLQAMGVGPQEAQGAIRASLGWSTTEADVDRCVEAWRRLARTLVKGGDETRIEPF